MVCIALAKGRVAREVLDLLIRAGYDLPTSFGRQLRLTTPLKTLSIILVKSDDVVTYVTNGVADVGIVGKDLLLESKEAFYELLDLGLGSCSLCLCGFAEASYQDRHHLRIATKYPGQTEHWLKSKGRSGQIIPLRGSVELGPLVGLSDFIVDIVETGNTLKANHLEVIESIHPITTRLIANSVLYKTKFTEITQLCDQLKGVLNENSTSESN